MSSLTPESMTSSSSPSSSSSSISSSSSSSLASTSASSSSSSSSSSMTTTTTTTASATLPTAISPSSAASESESGSVLLSCFDDDDNNVSQDELKTDLSATTTRTDMLPHIKIVLSYLFSSASASASACASSSASASASASPFPSSASIASVRASCNALGAYHHHGYLRACTVNGVSRFMNEGKCERRARFYYKEGAKMGRSEAAFNLAFIKWEKLLEKQKDKKIKSSSSSSSSSHVQAPGRDSLSVFLSSCRSIFLLLSHASSLGHTASTYVLTALYWYGIGVDASVTKAFECIVDLNNKWIEAHKHDDDENNNSKTQNSSHVNAHTRKEYELAHDVYEAYGGMCPDVDDNKAGFDSHMTAYYLTDHRATLIAAIRTIKRTLTLQQQEQEHEQEQGQGQGQGQEADTIKRESEFHEPEEA